MPGLLWEGFDDDELLLLLLSLLLLLLTEDFLFLFTISCKYVNEILNAYSVVVLVKAWALAKRSLSAVMSTNEMC